MADADILLRELESNIAAALAERSQASVKAIPAPPQRKGQDRLAPPTMKLPDGLALEAAIIIFEFWESNSTQAPIRWEDLPPRFQRMWVEITRVVLEMTLAVTLTDIHRYFEASNGDMGVAFAKTLRRYAAEVLETDITP